jgi:hypothetical protein
MITIVYHQMSVIPVERVGDMKRIIRKKCRAKLEERHEGFADQKKRIASFPALQAAPGQLASQVHEETRQGP